MTRIAGASAAVLWAMLSTSATARAGGPLDQCLSAPVEGQKLQKAGKLLDARDRFATCAQKTCPDAVVEDCMRWARQVDDALPSVVVAARDAQGHDLSGVRVSIDGKEATELGTRAVRLDPGAHRFVFQRGGSAEVEQRVMLREGEKNREVVASYAAPPGTAPAGQGPASQPEGGVARPTPLGVWVLGGVGFVALASFATFGTLGVLDRGTNHCDSGCPSDQKSAVDAKFLIADVSLGVGVVALGVATWLYLARPAVEQSSAVLLDVRPVPGGGVAVYGASF